MNAWGNPHKSRLMPGIILACPAVLLLLPIFARSMAAAGKDTVGAPLVLEIKLDGEVAPILATHIDEGLDDAARRHAALALITMDTPGGLSDSMTDIIHHILDSQVPVAVYVTPAGARGASAGFLILLSALFSPSRTLNRIEASAIVSQAVLGKNSEA